MNEEELISFDLPKEEPTIIKVVGVGGGGGNAVNNMYREGIKDVSYLICNTDKQVLYTSPIPNKLQLGPKTTNGLGAGNNPQKAREAAIESTDDIKQAIGPTTKMLFVTAGMGGGTGTGAAPVVAGIARSMDILTVGIVTIPFSWETEAKIDQAMDGVEEISKQVDALLVINNEQLGSIYPDLSAMNAFKKADEVLTIAAKSIAEIITIPGYINLDFADVKTIMKDGGVAVMSAGRGSGPNRLEKALNDALHSPLLNNNDVYHAKKILFNISCSKENEILMSEISQMKIFMSRFVDKMEQVIWGISCDDELGEELKITMLASGFGISDISGASSHGKEISDNLSIKTDEERRKRNMLKQKYYGGDKGAPSRRVYFNAVVLSEQQMDDEKLIESLLQQPSNQRVMW